MSDELISLADARRLVPERTPVLGAESVPVGDAIGRVLAAEVRSAAPVPGFDNSAMDGYAVRAADTVNAHVPLHLVGESRAGRPATATVGPGEAIAISTGAVVPAGADAVVPVEDTALSPNGDGVEVRGEVAPGRHVRRAGEDIAAGEVVLRPGTVIGPAEAGVIVSVGLAEVPCAHRPAVAVLATGDELREPGEALEPGTIHNSNAYTVSGLARQAGADVEVTAKVPDDPAATREAIAAALGHDVAVICGGVSVGEHDHVKRALAELGVEQVFWGLALRPGKPTYFGVHEGGLVFGLPGNPVSAMVTFLLLVRPALLAMQGADPAPQVSSAILGGPCKAPLNRTHAVRCRLELRDDGLHAIPTGEQGSHVLTSMLGADALAIIPAGAGELAAGERVEIELLRPYSGR